MHHTELIDKLVRELSYRVGIPNVHKKEHQSIMSEILSEWGEYDVKERIFEFLTNEDDTEGDDKDYAHIGKGFYVKATDKGKDGAQKYTKDDSGKLKAISDKEYDKEKEKQGELFLVCAVSDTKINVNRLHQVLGCKRLSFGKTDVLKSALGITPGSVTLFSIINDTALNVTLVIDKFLMDYKIVNFHPLLNDATTAISSSDMIKFAKSTKHEPLIVDFAKLE